jgi:crossover junction endodeoxyribonuclease RuvC
MIIGIDPGLQHTGWGVIQRLSNNSFGYVASGVISTSAMEGLPERLYKIMIGLENALSREGLAIKHAAIEEIYVNKNYGSSLKLAHARGVAIATIAKHGIPIASYQAKRIKQAIVGNGKADKIQMQNMIKILLPSANIIRHDTADALAIAICHAFAS